MNTYIESYLSNAAMTNGSGNAPGKLNPSDYDNLLMLRNKRPVWDAHHGGHVLNFHGRVTKSSVKNFQLCIEKNWFIKHLHSSASNTTNKKNHHHSDDEEDFEEYRGSPSSPCPFNDVILQFGKIASDKFTMDVQYPLSIYQAYAICIACMDGKLADRKGYEYIKKLTGYNGNNNGSHSTDTSEEKVSEDINEVCYESVSLCLCFYQYI